MWKLLEFITAPFCISNYMFQPAIEIKAMTKAKMTRQQAIECFKKHMPTKTNPESVIDFYIEAGILEIIEEQTLEQKIKAAFAGRDIRGHNDLLNILNKYRLKIVEK